LLDSARLPAPPLYWHVDNCVNLPHERALKAGGFGAALFFQRNY